jgi:hypothetical protein
MSALKTLRDVDQHVCAEFCNSVTPIAQFTQLQEE